MAKVVVQSAQSNDLRGVYTMLCELEGVKLDWKAFTKVWSGNLKSRDIFYLVAVIDTTVVGYLSLHIQNLLHHAGRVAEIQEVVVAEALRGFGIGKKLLEQAGKMAKQERCKVLEVTCNVKRKGAHRFYEREGMKKTHYKFTRLLRK